MYSGVPRLDVHIHGVDGKHKVGKDKVLRLTRLAPGGGGGVRKGGERHGSDWSLSGSNVSQMEAPCGRGCGGVALYEATERGMESEEEETFDQEGG
jgi:hypothetical protein